MSVDHGRAHPEILYKFLIQLELAQEPFPTPDLAAPEHDAPPCSFWGCAGGGCASERLFRGRGLIPRLRFLQQEWRRQCHRLSAACDKGEGLQETYGTHDWKGSSGSGKCDCILASAMVHFGF